MAYTIGMIKNKELYTLHMCVYGSSFLCTEMIDHLLIEEITTLEI